MGVPWFYYVGKITTRIILILFTRWKVMGREHIPTQGPVLIIANHLNQADPPLLSASIGRRIRFMAKEELFRSKIIGFFIRSFGSFPVNRRRVDRKALRQASEVLVNGEALAMFPEGMRSLDAQLQRGFQGSALIASRNMGVPIIPVGITGAENMKGIAWPLKRPHIIVNIGAPFYLPSTNGKLTREELAQLTTFMMEHIAELLPEEYQGHYAGQGN